MDAEGEERWVEEWSKEEEEMRRLKEELRGEDTDNLRTMAAPLGAGLN